MKRKYQKNKVDSKKTKKKVSNEKKNFSAYSIEELKQLDLKQLVLLKDNIEDTLNKTVTTKLMYSEDQAQNSNDRSEMLTFLITNNNVIEGYNKDYNTLYIGKIFAENQVIWLKYSTELPYVRCFVGYADFDKQIFKGHLYADFYTRHYVDKMHVTQDIENARKDKFKLSDVSGDCLSVHVLMKKIAITESIILKHCKCKDSDKALIQEIKGI